MSVPRTGEVVELLKDGYWDRTAVVRLPDGSLRVRKENKVTDEPGPWALSALRSEISFIRNVPEEAREYFPPLLDAWGTELDATGAGYEIPYYPEWTDVAKGVASGAFDQAEADEIQRHLGRAVLVCLHSPVDFAPMELGAHVGQVILKTADVLAESCRDEDGFLWDNLIHGPNITLNGETCESVMHYAKEFSASSVVRERLDGKIVRLHGDLILENMLWRRNPEGGDPSLVLIDPVSVAGVSVGHPVFDLVKYESYASGELFALRSEQVLISCERGIGATHYSFEVDWGSERIQPFRNVDLRRTFRSAYTNVYGDPDPFLYGLLDGYFSLVMAVNTEGLQQRARVLKALEAFRRASEAV